MSINSYSKFISEQSRMKKVLLGEEKLGINGETHEELEANSKETFHALKRNMKNNNVPHHSGEHHAGEDYGDVIDHAGHYNGQHVYTQLNYEDHVSYGKVPKLKEKSVHKEVKRQNPHVSAEVHEKHANDIINFEKKFNQAK